MSHDTDTTNVNKARLSGGRKLLVELGPLLVMLVGYFKGAEIGPYLDGFFRTGLFSAAGNEMFTAVALFLPAFLLAFIYSVAVERRISPILLVTGILVCVLGGLTLFLQNKTFIYLKPTITYLLFAGILGGGQIAGRSFLKLLFDNAFKMPGQAWAVLTWRFVVCFGLMALANEFAWRLLTSECEVGVACAGEATWIKIKAFGFTAVYFLFMISQLPFLMRHMQDPDAPAPPAKAAVRQNASSGSSESTDVDPL